MDETGHLAPQFRDPAQQEDCATLGMWTFLATEVLFFGGLFVAYVVYRHAYPDGFAAGSQQTNLALATLNTGLLLTSSLTIALATQAARLGDPRSLARRLALTLLLAVGFLAIKGLEYRQDFDDRLVPGTLFSPNLSPGAELFFWLYWTMTGLHAIHVLIGLGLLAVILVAVLRGRFPHATPLEMTALYWHFVDAVWVFLYPLLYLIGSPE